MLSTDIQMKRTGGSSTLKVTLPEKNLWPRKINSRALELLPVEDGWGGACPAPGPWGQAVWGVNPNSATLFPMLLSVHNPV